MPGAEGDIINTLVYQSFRTQDVPSWMNTCMQSVREWAEVQGFSYRFIDDSFFTYAPEWFRHAVKDQRHLVSDFARLELARLYLDEGWQRVIWVDADVYVCNPHEFSIGVDRDHWLCHELWVSSREGHLHFSNRVNNAILAFSQDNRFLDFYRHACEKIVRSKEGRLRHSEIGTLFLSGIAHLLPLLDGVAIFSPLLLAEFYRNNQTVIAEYKQKLQSPINAVNLCLTFRNTYFDGLLLEDKVFDEIIKNLNG